LFVLTGEVVVLQARQLQNNKCSKPKYFLFLNQRKVLGSQMTSEKKNSSPAPESVAMGELKKASKENMNLVRAYACLSVCLSVWEGG
jgi:hypothetical protein